jgi:hypothetical protein
MKCTGIDHSLVKELPLDIKVFVTIATIAKRVIEHKQVSMFCTTMRILKSKYLQRLSSTKGVNLSFHWCRILSGGTWYSRGKKDS